MDRFKFRVWNKNTHSFTTGGAIKFGGLCFVDEEDFGIKLGEHQECYIIEQCTGLKDKNGNLIYEGDIILKSDTNGLGYGRIRECNVHWHNDWLGWAITTEYGDTYGLAEYASKQYEIIGNIHEQKD